MKVVTTHKNPDFDGFAAAYAYKKLNPDFEIVISGKIQQNLEEFLRLFEFKYLNESEWKNKIEKLVIVDNSLLSRVGKTILEMSKDAEILVYDHHPDIKNVDNRLEINSFNVGAITTYFVKKIMKRNIVLNEREATLFAIAIYEDTGNFLYNTTSPLDFEVAKFLIENGANIDIIHEFTTLELNAEQKNLLRILQENLESFVIQDYELTISKAEIEKFIGGLNVITTKLWDFTNDDTLIVVVRMGKKTYIVGRTKNPDVRIKKLMEFFDGTGHERAASATLVNVSVDEVIYKIKEKFPECVTPSLRAKDIMSYPVRTILANESIKRAYEIMQITGHGGLPVVEKNKLIGIVTRKAVDKAMNHNLEDRPVKSIMNTKLITVEIDTSVQKIREIMLENDIGRVPVLDKNNILVGIITRSDLLRATNSERRARFVLKKEDTEDVKDLMFERLPKRLINLLRLLGEYGEELNMPVYVVGGFVRDLLLGIENFDVDIVVEGDGLEYAKYVAKQLEATMVSYEKFLTASIFFKDGYRIDIATARTEYYERPAELPLVDISTIKKDLYRRDFTINAMAIKLNLGNFGVLYDFFGSRDDLNKGIIRVLHKLSFIEDPTRIIRAVRFEQRFGFNIEKSTLELLERTLEEGYLEKVTGQRVRQELEKILEEKKPLDAIKRLANLKILNHIFAKTYYTKVMEEKLKRLFAGFQELEKIYGQINKFYCVLRILLEFYDEQTLKEVVKKYGIPKKFADDLKVTEKKVGFVKEMVEKRVKFSELYKILGKPVSETAAHIVAYLDREDRKYLFDYLRRVFNTKLEKVSGNMVIKKYNLKASPLIGKIMNELFCKKLDNPEIDEIEELDKLVAKYFGGVK
ncbi:CBS domain-containing protein [Thermosipho atlanticus]|uniref:tRNA nucleotidyltransferase (CCA-adding enzyme) n=1 Tax=Thermosipho atlanticus DSM 15807 TaxID=1123380 RepID=A0A1M5R0S7_9BACT|nr:CBS domain-containing protein [Thermosipho atlanticus]SHH20004.1 tRNA nucleotidyltransferase (CCA-adding enzyme) [Thermosipho atlanticus DSM 15807]